MTHKTRATRKQAKNRAALFAKSDNLPSHDLRPRHTTKPQSWPPNSPCNRSALSKSNLTSFSTPSRRQSLAELARADADGTKTLDWDSEHQRLPSMETTSVCGAFPQAIAIISVDKGLFMVDNLLVALRAIERNGMLTSFYSCRQEVPIHWSRLHPWPHPYRYRCFHQDAPHTHHPPRIPPFHPQVRQIREETQESCCARFASFPCRGG
jgi:hypothetical protein